MWSFKRRRSGRDSIEINEFLHDDDAERLRDALLRRDWPTARTILTAARGDHLALGLRIAAQTPGVQEWIAGPIRDEPGSTLPLLVRGAHAIYWAWEARGTGMAGTVSRETWDVWFQRLKLAENCLNEVVDRDPRCAEAWHYLVVLGRARQLPAEERWLRFDRLVALDPHHLFGHQQMLNNVMAKWSGSAEAMFDFARTRAAAAPGTALPVLVAQAHLEHRYDNGGFDYLERDEVRDELWAAAEQSIWHDDYPTTLLTPILWNTFAFALTYAGFHRSATDIFASIGDDWVCKEPWGSVEFFQRVRAYAHSNC